MKKAKFSLEKFFMLSFFPPTHPKMKKAVFFSTDALLALIIITVALLLIYPTAVSPKESISNLQQDVLTVLSSLKIGEFNNNYVQSLIISGKIKDINKTLLDQIGEFYIENASEAEGLSQAILDQMDTKENIGIWFGDNLLASKNKTAFEVAKNIETDKLIISGIEKGKSSEGFVAKAWLQKITQKGTSLVMRGDVICGGWRNYSYGEYCSSVENNITYLVNIPENATISSASWLAEGSWTNQNSKLYVNGVKVFDGSIAYYSIIDVKNYVHTGENQFIFYSTTGGDDGATHISVNYIVPDMQTFKQETQFNFAKVISKSVLHHERSIFIPTAILSMNVTLNTSRDTSLYLAKSTTRVFIGKKNPVNNTIIFSDTEIKNALTSAGIQYSSLSNEYFSFIVDIGKDVPAGTSVSIGAGSYINIQSSEVEIPYGSIDLTQEIPVTNYSHLLQNTFYNNLVWSFSLPTNAIPLIASWQFGWLSTSGDSATNQNVSANSVALYRSPPSPYIPALSRWGYTPSRATGLFNSGINNLTLDFGSSYGVSRIASQGFITYFIRSYVNYGDTKEKAKGGTRTITFEDGSTKQFHIGNSTDAWDPNNDSIDDAVERLISQLDANNNGKVDLLFNEEDFNIDSLDIAGVPYIRTTEVNVRKWN